MFETIVSFTLLEHMAGATFVPPTANMGYERVLSPNRTPCARSGCALAAIEVPITTLAVAEFWSCTRTFRRYPTQVEGHQLLRVRMNGLPSRATTSAGNLCAIAGTSDPCTTRLDHRRAWVSEPRRPATVRNRVGSSRSGQITSTSATSEDERHRSWRNTSIRDVPYRLPNQRSS